jgi:hypothetical protein
LGDQLDEAAPALPADPVQAAKDANALVEQLKQNPNNVIAREKLARVFAERLDKPQLGIEQLELLLGMVENDDGKKAEWLGLVAAWHLKYRHDPEAGRKALERLTLEHPGSVQAFAARRRLEQLSRQLRMDQP